MYSQQTVVGLHGCKTLAVQDTKYEVCSNENHSGSCWMRGVDCLKCTCPVAWNWY
jgi:hypothetical protein